MFDLSPTEFRESTSLIKDISKEFLDTKLLLIKCHLMNGDDSVGLRLLNETRPNVELIYGLVSDESAKALEMTGSLEMAKGNIEIAYQKLNNAYQVYQALDHNHKQLPKLSKIIKSLLTDPRLSKYSSSSDSDKPRFSSTIKTK